MGGICLFRPTCYESCRVWDILSYAGCVCNELCAGGEEWVGSACSDLLVVRVAG